MVSNRVKKIRPVFFKSDFLEYDLLELYKTTLNEKVLNIKDEEFSRYCDAIIEFWEVLPERMYAID